MELKATAEHSDLFLVHCSLDSFGQWRLGTGAAAIFQVIVTYSESWSPALQADSLEMQRPTVVSTTQAHL